MGLFNKLLHAGEGKRLKAVQAIVPEVAAFEPEMERLSDDQLAVLIHAASIINAFNRISILSQHPVTHREPRPD